MKLQALFAKVSRTMKMVLGALVIGGALLVGTGGQAHAAPHKVDISVLLGGTKGSGESCPDWSKGQTGVYLYSNINYEGRCAFFTPKAFVQQFNVDSVNRSVHNDAASSMRIRGSIAVELYKDKDWKGGVFGISSDVPDFRDWIFTDGTPLNDNTSSLLLYMQ